MPGRLELLAYGPGREELELEAVDERFGTRFGSSRISRTPCQVGFGGGLMGSAAFATLGGVLVNEVEVRADLAPMGGRFD